MITQKHELYGVEKHMSAIIVENLTFSYPGSYDNIFENTSFQLDTSWKLGLVGRNGRGKTTLCKLLMNQYEYTGKIICNEKFVYFPCKIENKERMTIEILQEVCPSAQEWEFMKEMKKFTSQDIRKVKNDRIDSIHIAMYGLTYWSELEEFKPANEVYAELRTLSRQYDNTIALLVGARSNFANLINNVMPGIDKMLADGNKSNRTIAFVEHYVHFENITKKSEKQFVNDVMKWKTKKGYHISEAKAKEIYALAQNGIPVLPNTKSTTIIVREAAKLIYELKSTRDTILAQMQAFAKTLPEYSIIRDMSCIGEVLSARIIAEIGDITKYKNKHSLIAYAGIDAPPYQSGKFNATERHVSKRGNAYLRKIGYEIMQSLIMHKPDGDPVFDYITRKRAEGKPAKAAMIAGLNKFLRIYYGKVSELYSSLYSYC